MRDPVVAFGIALIASAAAYPAVAKFSRVIGWMDHPGGLKLHARPTPYGGGLCIVFGILIALLFLFGTGGGTQGVGLSRFPFPLRVPPNITVILGSGLMIFFGGVWDDFRSLRVPAKFALQIVGALILIVCGVHLDIKIFPTWLDFCFTVFWLVGMTNAINIIDIMDGLAGGVSGLAAFTFGLIGFLFGNSDLAILSWALAGGIVGFLIFNLHPARIFMGDAGAQFVGFVLGAAAVEGSYTTFNSIALLAPVLILGLPIYDTALVSLLRIRKGISPFKGSPDHVALRLRRMGFSLGATLRICYLMTAVLAAAATAATIVTIRPALVIYSFVIFSAIIFGLWISRVDVEEVADQDMVE